MITRSHRGSAIMLWGSLPDDQSEEVGRRREAPRPAQCCTSKSNGCSKGPRGRQFVEDFAGQWLDLVDIDFTEPDRKLYREFDISSKTRCWMKRIGS